MSYPGRTFHRPAAPTKAQQRVALFSMLTMRRTLEGLRPENLARTHGLPLAEVEKAIADAVAQRAAK